MMKVLLWSMLRTCLLGAAHGLRAFSFEGALMFADTPYSFWTVGSDWPVRTLLDDGMAFRHKLT
jgi:hypothetical protein